MNERLGFGVVGVNPRIRRSILAGLSRARQARLVAVCSRDPVKAAQTAAEFGGVGYTSFDEMLTDPQVEAVFICTPHRLHHPMALAAFAAGKRVVCEKPLALTLAEAEEMAAAAQQSGLPNAVNFTYHSMSGHRAIARLLAEGTVGRIQHLSLTYWQARQKLPGAPPGDALLEIGSHLIDLVYWWSEFGQAGEIRTVSSQEVLDERGQVPMWSSLARTDRDAIVTIQGNRTAAGWRNGMDCWLVGDAGTLGFTFDTDTASIQLARFGDGSPEGILHPVAIPDDLQVSYQDFPHVHLDRLSRALLGEESFPDFAYGLRVQHALEALKVAAQEKRWVELAELGASDHE
ncbi:MAG TPA: Gfo/Idh/MocA family oxidoreductase [Chloroflexota bacterium]|nr:Gfo/Idh/MocA family oxidoreductase [Chloroflexota bacterium]